MHNNVNTITRAFLINLLSSKYTDIPCHVIKMAVKQVFVTISQALMTSRKVELRNFGVFSLRLHAARLARNPKTGDIVKLKPRYTVHFKPGKELNARINKNI